MSEQTEAEVTEPNPAPAFSPSNNQLEAIERSFTFFDITEDQKVRQKNIYEAARGLGRAIFFNVKEGGLQMEAIQNLCRAVMVANQSIQFEK